MSHDESVRSLIRATRSLIRRCEEDGCLSGPLDDARNALEALQSPPAREECVCAEINSRNCPVHQQDDREAKKKYLQALRKNPAAWARIEASSLDGQLSGAARSAQSDVVVVPRETWEKVKSGIRSADHSRHVFGHCTICDALEAIKEVK